MGKTIKYIIALLCVTWWACEDSEDGRIPVIEPNESTSILYSDGVSIISDDSLAFVLFAPYKQTVHLIGDFNDWTVSDTYKMQRMDADTNRFIIKIGNLEKGKEYICQYLIDNEIRIADPYSSKIVDPENDKYITADVYPNLIEYPIGKTSEIAGVVSTTPDTYAWQVNNFKIQNPDNAVIYELHFRDFTTEGTVKAAMAKIPYLKSLGVSIVELMPINEFEGNDSWGYNPSFYFAVDKAYGTAADYRAFIDECHANDIGVLIDMVLNHSYGASPLVRMYQTDVAKPSAQNPWYNVSSNFANPDAQWGADFNHNSKHTRALIDSVCAYWMSAYKVDGFRLDFTKGFSNTVHPATGDDSWGSLYDPSRITNLRRIFTEIKKRNANAMVICEHLAENSEEKELASLGYYLWGNMNYNFNETTMGWMTNADISWASYLQRQWTKPHLVTYMESHDEERLMYKNLKYGNVTTDGSYSVKDLNTALKRQEAAAVILMALPGPKMIWQFGELGYDVSIDYNGRTGKKPIHWEYYDVPERRAVYNTYAKINTLRQKNEAFSTTDYQISIAGAFKQILLQAPTPVCVMANFEVVEKTADVYFGTTGIWKDYFSNEELNVTSTAMSVTLAPGEYRLYIKE